MHQAPSMCQPSRSPTSTDLPINQPASIKANATNQCIFSITHLACYTAWPPSRTSPWLPRLNFGSDEFLRVLFVSFGFEARALQPDSRCRKEINCARSREKPNCDQMKQRASTKNHSVSKHGPKSSRQQKYYPHLHAQRTSLH